jgi:spermidine synthase
MNFRLALAVVAAAGFVALSYEITWFRVYGFLTGGTAGSFGVMLAAYLAGVALGSVFARRACKDDDGHRPERLRLPALLTAVASILGFLLLPYIAWHVTVLHWTASLPAVATIAGLSGAILPLIAHFGVAADHRAGERLSLLYLANIVGCTAGSLTTGFVLLDVMPLRHVSIVLTVIGLALAWLLFAASRPRPRAVVAAAMAALALTAAAMAATPALYDRLWPRLQRKTHYDGKERFARVIENRSGIIAVDNDHKVYGSGIYDGRFSTGLTPDSNIIYRAYAIAAVHQKPTRVLMIGLSTGAWANVLIHAPGVERLDTIEINPGYLQLIADEPLVAPLLRNPRSHIHIDDGRRWLRANPTATFDVIVQNTTYHWRGHITNLLSGEYMALIRSHLNPNGVFMFNTTSSAAAQKTACEVFDSGFRLSNFMFVSNAPALDLDLKAWRSALEGWKVNGVQTFDLSLAEHRAVIDELISRRDKPIYFDTCAALLVKHRDETSITDDNMRSEFDEPWYRSH